MRETIGNRCPAGDRRPFIDEYRGVHVPLPDAAGSPIAVGLWAQIDARPAGWEEGERVYVRICGRCGALYVEEGK